MKKVDKAIEILQAFKEGKTIEYSEHQVFVPLISIDAILFHLQHNDMVRIAKEPTYRPYANEEEFLEASKEHGPYLVTTCDAEKVYEFPTRICNNKVHICIHNVITSVSYDGVLKYWKWQDGTLCGILEQ